MKRPGLWNQLRDALDRAIGKGRRRKDARKRQARGHVIEPLEARQLLSVSAIDSEQLAHPTVLGSQVLADSGRALAALPDHGYTLVYQAQTTESGWDVYSRRYGPDGTAQDPVRVNSVTAGDQQRASIATAPDGTAMVVYQGPDANLAGIYAQRLDAAGQPLGSPIPLNETVQGEQQMPDVARLSGGQWIVT